MIILAWLAAVTVMLNTGACPGVIGVVYNQDGVIRDVYENSPAALARIKLNDKILDRHSTRGKVGTTAVVKLIRNGELIVLDMKRVCVRDLEGRSW